LEILLGADKSADPAPPELDAAVFELITDKTLFFLQTIKDSNKKDPTKLRKRVSKDQSLEISDTEKEREGLMVLVVVAIVARWEVFSFWNCCLTFWGIKD
jgi:hypothetical protein